jgi:hypothetical protein
MKKFLAALPFLFVAPLALASYSGPLLIKTQSPGFSPEAYRLFSRCEISRTQVKLVHGVGSLQVTEIRPVSFEMSSLAGLVAKAAQAQVVVGIGPTDGPSTSYEAIQILSNDKTESLTLKQTGTSQIEVQGYEATQLRNFLDVICGQAALSE